MTKPKKWYLEELNGKVILKDLNGPIRKPNAAQSLGGILCVRVTPDEYLGKYTVNEVLMVSIIIIVKYFGGLGNTAVNAHLQCKICLATICTDSWLYLIDLRHTLVLVIISYSVRV